MSTTGTVTQQAKKVIETVFTYRVRPAPGLEKTLLKELKALDIPMVGKPTKINGRNIIEVQGPQTTLWHMMFKSRIAEDIQVRVTQPFLARGEKELETNLQKIPWHCYLPDAKKHQDMQFKMPQTRAKSHMSKLFHTQMIRDILIEQLTDLQIRKDFKQEQLKTGIMSFKAFKKEWLQRKQAQEKKEISRITREKLGEEQEQEESSIETKGEEEETQKKKIKGLDEVRAELQATKEFQKGLKEISKVQINLNKDRAEILIGTSNEELHKHGYKPFIRWGILKETLTAACILESGILKKANKTGKLYLWDPFCGSGSFLIETIMMLLEQPVRNFETSLPFEYWPIHKKEEYEEFKSDLNDFQKMKKKHDIDIQLIGSDISQKAIDTSIKNVDYSDIQGLIEHDLINVQRHKIINNPLIYSQQWPKNYIKNNSTASESTSLLNFKETERSQCLSLYHGDFQEIGYKLADLTEDFKDFSILTNVPYGVQSKEKQRQTDTDLHHLYRRFGRFLRLYPNLELNTFVLAQAHHYGHKLSFEKFSNCGWSKEIAFTNGGLGVHLLKYDMTQVSQVKQTVEAYKQIGGEQSQQQQDVPQQQIE